MMPPHGAPEPPGAPGPPEVEPQAKLPPKRPVNILLVGDQPDKLLSYEVVLGELGERLIKATSGAETVGHLLGQDIAVVLLDVRVPEFDGFELARMIREHARLHSTPIILVSATSMSDLDRLRGYHSGSVDYVPWPIIPEVLRAKVRAFAELFRTNEELRRLNEVTQPTVAPQASAELALHSEEWFRFLADNIPCMVWTANPEGHITYANRRWLTYCGLSSNQPDPHWPAQHVHPEDVIRWREIWKQPQQGRPIEIEVRKRRHDGAYRWFLTRAVPRIDRAGRLAGYFGVSIDIHEQKQLQSQLQEADRRKDEFLAMLAHELRNPLAPILNAVTTLGQQSLESSKQAWCRDVIQRQVDHLRRLVDDLLDVSRITRGKFTLQFEVVDLGVVAARAVEAWRPAVEARGHSLHTDLPPEPLYVEGDFVRLSQVVGNLIANAVKFTDDGGRIDVRVARGQGAGRASEGEIRVRDNGLGIPADMLCRIFDLFVQGESRTPSAPSGLGIGLSLVQKFVELHHGTVEAHSEGTGHGSEFVVRLPLAQQTPHAGSTTTPTLDRKTVLVADDNVDSADSLALLLGACGHDVHTVYDGHEAVAAAERLHPAIILLDVGMPGMDGYAAAKLIRSTPAGRAALLIAQTGWGQEHDRRRSQEAGFDAHLTKPLDPDALLEWIAKAETQRGLRGARDS